MSPPWENGVCETMGSGEEGLRVTEPPFLDLLLPRPLGIGTGSGLGRRLLNLLAGSISLPYRPLGDRCLTVPWEYSEILELDLTFDLPFLLLRDCPASGEDVRGIEFTEPTLWL
jgi:hypothetical protein